MKCSYKQQECIRICAALVSRETILRDYAHRTETTTFILYFPFSCVALLVIQRQQPEPVNVRMFKFIVLAVLSSATFVSLLCSGGERTFSVDLIQYDNLFNVELTRFSGLNAIYLFMYIM